MIFKLLHDTINKIYYSFKIFDGRFQMIELLSIALKHSNIILNSIFIGAFILNLLFAFTIIFMERRSANSIWAWLLVLVFLPLFGFILYLLLGRQIQRDQIFKIDKEDKKGLELIVDEQLAALKNENFSNSNYQIVKFKENDSNVVI